MNEARLRVRLFHVFWRFWRPVTMGVRAVVLNNGETEVFLVRHTYLPGWHLPGGGVEPGEHVLEAMTKELLEEGNLRLVDPPELLGIYHNTNGTKRDHVVVYVSRSAVQDGPRLPDREIAEARYFSIDDLPEATTRPTRVRIAEALGAVPVSPHWNTRG